MKPRYFLPEWDDLVDPSYDFENDVHSAGSSGWEREVYAHQLYERPNCDGLLMSRVVAEKSKAKRDRIRAMGVHAYCRVPESFPIFGDCGAFGYIDAERPPYSTDEVLDYYTRLGFDFGVSVDHLIVASTHQHREYRYGLTIDNAEQFIRAHAAAKLPWLPVGAVQGWDVASYRDAAVALVKQGYTYIALGGLVRTPSSAMLPVIEAVRAAIPSSVWIHLFGVARDSVIKHAQRLGVASFDSASMLRRAWLGSGQNYLSADGEWFAAIRVPQVGKSFRAKRMVGEGRATTDEVVKLEAETLRLLRAYGRSEPGVSVEATLDAVMAYDHLITPERPVSREQMRHTLESCPWAECSCAICQEIGIDVVIFRGNNRNRRRGFHNTWAYYGRLEQQWLS